jgi:hypothetical protein
MMAEVSESVLALVPRDYRKLRGVCRGGLLLVLVLVLVLLSSNNEGSTWSE